MNAELCNKHTCELTIKLESCGLYFILGSVKGLRKGTDDTRGVNTMVTAVSLISLLTLVNQIK